jgi:hypothetical protein
MRAKAARLTGDLEALNLFAYMDNRIQHFISVSPVKFFDRKTLIPSGQLSLDVKFDSFALQSQRDRECLRVHDGV